MTDKLAFGDNVLHREYGYARVICHIDDNKVRVYKTKDRNIEDGIYTWSVQDVEKISLKP